MSHVEKDNNLSNRLNAKLTISHNGHTDRQTELRKCTVVYVNKNCTDFIKRLHSQYIFFTIFFIAFTYLHDKKIVHDESRHRSIAFRTESDFIHVLCSKYISTIVCPLKTSISNFWIKINRKKTWFISKNGLFLLWKSVYFLVKNKSIFRINRISFKSYRHSSSILGCFRPILTC